MSNITEAVSSEQDAAYLAAVETGDTKTCAKMVVQAAKAAGYTIGPVVHGTQAQFTRFDPQKTGRTQQPDTLECPAFFFTSDALTALWIANAGALSQSVKDTKIMHVMLRIENPIKYDPNKWGDPDSGIDTHKLARMIRMSKEQGRDGAVYKSKTMGDTYVVFDPSQIKSADPVTYDDQGEVIPLSQRFNPAKEDIRESVEDTFVSRVSVVKKNEEMLKPPMPPKVRIEATFTINTDPEQVKLFRRWVDHHAGSPNYRPDYPDRSNYRYSLDYLQPAGQGKFRVTWYVPQDNPHPNVDEVLAFLQLMWEDFQQLPPPPEKKPRVAKVRDEEGRALPPTTLPDLDEKVVNMLIADLEPYWTEWGQAVVDFLVKDWEKYLAWADAHDQRPPREYAKETETPDTLSQWSYGYAPIERVRPKFEREAQYIIKWSRYKFLAGVAKYLPTRTAAVKEVTRHSLGSNNGAVEGVWDILYEDGAQKRLTTKLIWAGGYNIQREHTRYLVRVTDLASKPVQESQEPQPTQEMVDWFEERTRRHIRLAQEYGEKIAAAFPEYASLPEEMKDHDASKFEEPEYIPYVFMTWQRKNPKFKLPTSVDITNTTLHHVVSNTHHPEFWSPNPSINSRNRDAAPAEAVDARRMPEISIAEMCADWAAMSKEMGNSPLDWAEKQIGKRWTFTPEQEALIYTLLEAIWPPEGDPELQEEGLFSKKPVVYTGDVKTPKVNPKRFTAPAYKISPQNEFGGLYGVLSMSLPWGPKKKTEIWDIIYQRVRDRYWTTAFQGKRNKQGDFRELIRDFLDSQYGASIGGDLLTAARFSEFLLYQTAQECSMRSWDAYWRNYLRYREWD